MDEYYIFIVYAQRAIKYGCMLWAVYLIYKDTVS